MHHSLIPQLSLAIAMGYFFFILYLMRNNPDGKDNKNYRPTVTVLVPFRNEANEIEGCIESLKGLTYPRKKLQIILLNDASEDGSGQLAHVAVKDSPHMQVLDITENKNGLMAKMNALAQGIRQSQNELIFVTDADCRVQPDWIDETVRAYDMGTAMVAGITVARDHRGQTGMFYDMQQLDWIFLQSLAIGAANSDKPFTVMGNNLSFKRKVYIDLGGFEKIGFSVDEDHALMQAIRNNTNYKIKYILKKNSAVFTQGFSKFGDFIRQRQRWVKGGLGANWYAYLVVLLTFIAHLITPLILITHHYGITAGTAIGLVFGVDYLMLTRALDELRIDTGKLKFVMYQGFLLVYSIVLAVTMPFVRRIEWKGRQF